MNTADHVAIWSCIICSNIQITSDDKYSTYFAVAWMLLALAIIITAKVFPSNRETK